MKTAIKQQIFNTPEEAYIYAFYHHREKLNLECEKLIATSAKYSWLYSCYVTAKRFKLGEKTISKSAEYSWNYASCVLCYRFKLGEKSIFSDPKYSILYEKSMLTIIKVSFSSSPPLDLLECCSIKSLECLLEDNNIKDKKDVIKVLFKKKILNNE